MIVFLLHLVCGWDVSIVSNQGGVSVKYLKTVNPDTNDQEKLHVNLPNGLIIFNIIIFIII